MKKMELDEDDYVPWIWMRPRKAEDESLELSAVKRWWEISLEREREICWWMYVWVFIMKSRSQGWNNLIFTITSQRFSYLYFSSFYGTSFYIYYYYFCFE